MVLFELERRQVAETRMPTYAVVVLPPGFDDDLSHASRAKPLDAQTLVAEFASQGLIGAVLPGLPEWNTRAVEYWRAHLTSSKRLSRWVWVSGGAIRFSRMDRLSRLLDKNGIEFAGRLISV